MDIKQQIGILASNRMGRQGDVRLAFNLKNGGNSLEPDLEVEDSLTPFDAIYYNYDRFEIHPEDVRSELDRVVNNMKRKTNIKVKLNSHNDARRTNSYSMNLSRNRVKEAFDYLTSNGIAQERLDYSIHGEEILTNGCPNGVHCTEDKHQKNHRTEFKILRQHSFFIIRFYEHQGRQSSPLFFQNDVRGDRNLV